MSTTKKTTNNNTKAQAKPAKVENIQAKQAPKLPAQDPEQIEYYLKWLADMIFTFDNIIYDEGKQPGMYEFSKALENIDPVQYSAFLHGLKLLNERVSLLYDLVEVDRKEMTDLLFENCEYDIRKQNCNCTNCGALAGYHPTEEEIVHARKLYEEESARARELYGDD